ncbi:MAG: dTDP-glucose 4,6-dehydratase [Thermomicrobiales bacterium]|nr:dTDP-glucose 4,6-dehydratase [Thermomicrobiales bacterium]
MKILVTGGAGFIGSAYVRHVLAAHPADEVVTLDLLTYAGSLANLEGVHDDPRHRFVRGDIADPEVVDALVAACDAVVNFAAETHVDRSLLDSAAFVRANVTGVLTLLDAVRRHGKRLVQVSTDEVYGDVAGDRFSVETDPLLPRSPYAAAKAGGELMCRAYHVSYGTEVLVTRGCNTIGPRQYPEKLIPLFVTNALRDLPLPVYGDGRQVRDWLHVADHAAAVDRVLRHGRPGESYNVGAGNERPNIAVVQALLARLGKPASLIRHVPDRPGHDRRYALDWGKIRDELGWAPSRDFAQTLDDTIDWYVANPAWWTAIRDDDGFAAYYARQYDWRLAATAGEGNR